VTGWNEGRTNSLKAAMNKIVSLALLVGGVVLIVIGINATNSFNSDVSRFFTGSPTDKAKVCCISLKPGCRQSLSRQQCLRGVRPHFVGQELADHPLLQISTSLQILLAASSRLVPVVRVRSNLNHLSSCALRFGKRGGSDATFEQHPVKWLVVGRHGLRTRGAVARALGAVLHRLIHQLTNRLQQ